MGRRFTVTNPIVIRGNGKRVKSIVKAPKAPEQPRLVFGKTAAQKRADRQAAIAGNVMLLLLVIGLLIWLWS